VQSKKDQIEKKALTVVETDLADQLSQLQDNAGKLTAKVTPYSMESILQEKLVATSKQYDEYIHESQVDLDGTNQDIRVLEKELERERIISEGLQKQKNNNQRQLDELSAEFHTYKKELDTMNEDHDQKLNELHQIRQKANEEIKHLSIELGQQ
jgi:chromosome segregation ATPase